MSGGEMARILLAVLALAVAAQAKHERYEGHRLFRLTGPASEIRLLDDLDFWGVSRDNSADLLQAVLRLAPDEEAQWLQIFTDKGLSYELINENVAELFREEDVQVQQSKAFARRWRGRPLHTETFYTYEEVNDYIDYLGQEYPDLVTVINAALSYEGRQIKYVRISTTRFENLMKPVIVMDAAVHSREWVTTPCALELIHQLVVEKSDPRLLESIDWVIFPLANPDGYVYTHEEDRLWRKTRSVSHPGHDAGRLCVGVDGNRNFDFEWNTTSGTRNPCTQTYGGPSVFSEPEIVAIRNAILTHLDRIEMYISIHSHGNMFLYSWGNNGSLPSNALWLHLAGVTMAEEMDKHALPNAQRYVVGNAAQVLYYTTGTSRDWTRSVGIPLTYTLELPGLGYAFQVPPSYIQQIVTETWEGLKAGAHFILNNL